MKKQRILQKITIDKLWHWGVWIWRSQDWKKVLVQWGVLPWSIVDVIVSKSRKDFFEGRVFFVHELSREYAEKKAPCPHYFAPWVSSDTPIHKTWCGWCKRQQVSYEKQLKLKMSIIMDSFRGIKSHLEWAEMREIIWSPDEFWYRNKIEYSFGDFKSWDTHNTWALWFHKQWQFSQIIDIDECLLVTDTSRKLFHHLKALCKQSWLPIYNQKKHTWVLRHLVIREWINTWQFLVNISIADAHMDESQIGLRSIFQEQLKQDEFIQKHVSTCIISHNNWLWDAVFTNETIQRPLRGSWHIYEMLNLHTWTDWESIEARFKVSANSFFQTNTHWAEVLFSQAAQILWTVEWPIIDLYCWAWSIWISFNKIWIWSSIYWIELVPDAIIDAQHNAMINKVSSSYFIAGKAENLINTDETCKEVCSHAWCIIVDPPRDWLHKNVIAFLNYIRTQRPIKLLYISCNPVTLARDIEELSRYYKPRIVQPVDMFPHTHHIETICLLS
jgi:23S rRNA (uracil1939-C5)-methyltransferase